MTIGSRGPRSATSLLARIARADAMPAPSYGETIPEWRRRASEQANKYGRVAVWATSGGKDVAL
jgi:hypothetical protein